jgi:hypothetical protein
MSRIALLLLALCLTMGTIGCKEETTPAPAADPAAPAGDADADGDANATDAAPADPAAK